MNSTEAAGLGVALVLLLLIIRWRWRAKRTYSASCVSTFIAVKNEDSAFSIGRELAMYVDINIDARVFYSETDLIDATACSGGGLLFRKKTMFLRVQQSQAECPPCTQVQLVHRLCPHHNVVQSFEVEEKDSLDEHLDVLTRKLAEKEGRLRLSKSKIRETQHEIENLHAIDHDVRFKYREIMESLRSDLLCNEKECKRLQEQIEWVSRRRAELKEEVRRGQILYGEAAAELATNLAELQRGRGTDYKVTEKPQTQGSITSMRHRKEPLLPKATPVVSLSIKSPPQSPDLQISRSNIFAPP